MNDRKPLDLDRLLTCSLEELIAAVRPMSASDRSPIFTDFLRNYDLFRRRVEAIVDMPARMVDLLFNFLHQNGGTLSKRVREKEFAELTEQETARIEALYDEVFVGSREEFDHASRQYPCAERYGGLLPLFRRDAACRVSLWLHFTHHRKGSAL